MPMIHSLTASVINRLTWATLIWVVASLINPPTTVFRTGGFHDTNAG
jgi:hypothetical protein